MVYLIIAVVIVVVFALARMYQSGQKQKQKATDIASKWERSVDSDRNYALISSYNKYCIKNGGAALPDDVAADIDLENVFAFADRTNSKPGQQYLYQKLRSGDEDLAALHQLDALAELFNADEGMRLNAEIELSRMGNKNAYYLHELFTATYQPLYNALLGTYIKLAGVLWLSFLAVTIVHASQFSFLTVLGLTVLNFYLHYTNKRKITGYVYSLPQLHLLMAVTRRLLKLSPQTANTETQNSLQNLGKLKRTLSFVKFQNTVDNDPSDIASSVWELLKTLLLIEPAMFLISIDGVQRQKANIENLFVYVAKIDVAISVASLRLSLPWYCKPNFTSGSGQLALTGLYHPLIANCASNDLQVSATQGVLVTGSNMSGKTTFIRSVAINAILSQTLFTSCTQSYAAPFVDVLTSIRVSDDIEEHKSYFQAEALSVLNILNRSTASANNSLIIIDEIFRGTNTIERIAAAKAILSYLSANKNFVFVSTHDLELAELLGNEYAVYTFEEVAADTRLEFDYKIKPGLLKNKNGIAILTALGYPASVIADANAMGDALRVKYKL